MVKEKWGERMELFQLEGIPVLKNFVVSVPRGKEREGYANYLFNDTGWSWLRIRTITDSKDKVIWLIVLSRWMHRLW